MNSWNTTLFGLMGGIGAAVAMVDGIPHWLLISARVAAAAGVAGLGLAARDNNKTSEQVGAIVGAGAPRGVLAMLLAVFILSGLCAGVSLVGGCASTPQRAAYATAGATAVTIDAAMHAWGDYVKAYHPAASVELKVKAAFDKYKAAMMVVMDAGQQYATLAGAGSTNSPPAQAALTAASQLAAQDFADLLALLRSLNISI